MMAEYFSIAIVGVIFLMTGLAKAVNSKKFMLHIVKYDLFPLHLVSSLAILFISLECAWGISLILNEFSHWSVPASIALLLCLSALTIWSTSSNRTDDCGCYGGLLIVTPVQSIFLNLIYILLLGTVLLSPNINHNTDTWKWVFTLSTIPLTATLSWISKDKPLIDFYRLKIGHVWKRNWVKDSSEDFQHGTYFVVFMNENCHSCKKWIPFLNIITLQNGLPQVIGVLSINSKEIDQFKMEQNAQFPIFSMDKLLFGYMTDLFPTAVLIEDGKIINKWVGEIPSKYLDKIKQYYQRNISAPKELKNLPSSPEINYLKPNRITFADNYHYVTVNDFLNETEWNRLISYVSDKALTFVPAATSTNRADYRQSQVLYLFPEFSEIISKKLRLLLPNLYQELEIPAFHVSQIETQITAHGDGSYYKIHNDNGTWDTLTRELTFVYYFYCKPKLFSGGELLLYKSKNSNINSIQSTNYSKIEPFNNNLVVFPSRYFHEVLPVSCPNCSFMNSRFTLNGWIRKSMFS